MTRFSFYSDVHLFLFVFFSIRAKTTLNILFLSLSLTLAHFFFNFYFFFLNKLLILDEERLIFSPLSLESWEEALCSL